MKKIGIIGLGNTLRQDDAIGIILLNKLRNQKNIFSTNFEFVDGGTGGMNLLHLLNQFKKILLIDAVNFNEKPGVVKYFNINEVIDNHKEINLTTHDSNFLNIIKLSEKLDEKPDEIYVFGIQPKNTGFGEDLSEELKNNLEEIYNLLLTKVKNLE